MITFTKMRTILHVNRTRIVLFAFLATGSCIQL